MFYRRCPLGNPGHLLHKLPEKFAPGGLERGLPDDGRFLQPAEILESF
jgi:hypothetical protein